MKDCKLKLESFEIMEQTELEKKFLSNIMGGDNPPTDPNQCNTPTHTFSVQLNADIETAKER